ncbi:hypothetical protein BHU61_06735 [Macrococcus epidermidis]|uniref:Uncharacterized protein n=1 Tax=Macrococcus epidermidis TaxID=1902580 RepID=A0A327ZRQ4_9STAP|nr:hypothetical protein [Macrococcus epidermidis]RAK45003.1 hypothetical protein BHU61_06735 [Macrococcus epidermidis]
MAKFRVKKPFEGTREGRVFDKVGEVVEMTVKRAEEIQHNIDGSHPDYGEVLERLPEETTKSAAKSETDKE